jgi:hypothetical protein
MVRDKDEGDRLRRLSAVMRFLAQMRESVNERDLVEGLIQAAAVWYDLEARAYRRDLNGRYVLEVWLPGTDVSQDPPVLDISGLKTSDGPTHISSISEIEQFGWHAVQGELLLLPVAAGGVVRWLVVVGGTVEREIESTLMLVCRSAGGVIDQLTAQRGRDLQERLVRRMEEGQATFPERARQILDEYVSAVGAAAGRLVVHSGGRSQSIAAVGEGWEAVPMVPLPAGATEVSSLRVALALSLGNGATAMIELAAVPGRPLTIEQAQAARTGAGVLGVWLAGVSSAAAGPSELVAEPAPPPFEESIQGELERAKRLRLDGGVLVASLPAMRTPDPRALALIIHALRSELRSSDLLGQLAAGDIAAVLVRTSAEGVAAAAVRVRRRLDAMTRERQLPHVVVGHALYSTGTWESPESLVARARKEAGLVYS